VLDAVIASDSKAFARSLHTVAMARGLRASRIVAKPSRTSVAPNAFETAVTAPALADFAPAQNKALTPVDLEHALDADGAPSRQELLQRAASLGPVRMTWASLQLTPSDPILGEKMKPRVVERRARLRRLVKVALGACVAFCLVATAATALSSGGVSATRAPSRAATQAVVSVEKLETTARPRAASHITAARVPAWRAKRH